MFVTMTCNPKWPEIAAELKPGEQPQDRPDLITRVYEMKRAALMDEIVKQGIFGKVVNYVYVVEWQKRGLPHSHILITLDKDAKPTADDIDRLICAEIPTRVDLPPDYQLFGVFCCHPCFSQ